MDYDTPKHLLHPAIVFFLCRSLVHSIDCRLRLLVALPLSLLSPSCSHRHDLQWRGCMRNFHLLSYISVLPASVGKILTLLRIPAAENILP